ncbi:MAG: rod shape-determining protein MreB [Lachnospiraceae bacterium]|nr:rod shape-determining protein MreB [Lachnospiraceae bacterium]
MPVTDIGMDLGSANIRVWAKGKGIIINEPSVIAYDKDNDQILAYGEEANQIVARSQGNIVAVRPMKDGVISDYRVTERMLRYFLQRAMGRRSFRKPYLSICIPSGVTEVQKRAVEEAAYQSGAREVTMVNEIVAAAIGAGIDITKPVGNLVVDIGAGTCDMAVISVGAPVVFSSGKVAGNYFNEMISRYIRKNHGLFVDEDTSEEIKLRIGSAYRRSKPVVMQVSGRNVMTGLKKTISVNSEEIRQALKECTTQIAEDVHGLLEKTPPELAADVATRGIVMTGGGSQLDGLSDLIESRTSVNVMIAENPSCCVAAGTGQYTEMLDQIGRMEY